MQNVSKDLTHQLEFIRLFFFAFNWSIVDLQCCVWGVEQSDSDMYNKYICGIHKCVCVCVCVCMYKTYTVDFPDSWADKEATCNAGDPSLITGSGSYPWEGIGHPL